MRTSPALVPTPELLHDLVLRAAERWPGRIAVEDREQSMTYAQTAACARGVAARLRSLGAGTGDRVVLATPNSAATVAAMYGCSLAGATFAILGERYSPAQFRSIVTDARPSVVICSDVTRGHATGVPEIDLAEITGTPGVHADATVERPTAGHVAALVYTSGSTGAPRGVACPHHSMRFAARAIADRLGYREDDRIYVPIPLSFDYGLYQLFLAARVGATVVLRDMEPLGLALLRDLGQAAPTVVPVMPAIGSMLTRLAARRGVTVPSVRLLTNTGGHLGPGLCAELRRVFPSAGIALMYGLTECKRVSIAAVDADLDRPRQLGRPLDGTDVRVLDEDRLPAPVGEVGELYVAGPHVMAGYWGDDAATRDRFLVIDGRRWLRTGDAMSIAGDGTLSFHGRLDDQVKVRGVRCSSSEIEQAACSADGVLAVAVVTDPDGGVTLVYTGSAPVDRVVAHLTSCLGPWKVPDRVTAVEHLPRGRNGKPDHVALRARLAR